MKRWIQDANVGSIKNYYGVDIKGNAQESLGKRYFHLCHNFREVSILVAEFEIMYDYAKRCSDTLLKDLQEMRKKCYSLSMEDQTEVHDEIVLGDVLQGDNRCQSHKGITFQDICGIKTKPTVGRPKSRLKGVLERSRNPKFQRKKACESRQVQSLGCLNKVRYAILHYNI